MSTKKTKVLILGGGAGGAVVARRLSKWSRGEVEITILDKSEYHEFRPSYLWVMIGTREPDDVRRPLKLLEKYGIKVVRAEVSKIDAANRRVYTRDGASYEYDYLVVSLGSLAGEPPGDSCAPWELAGALECRKKLANLRNREPRVVVGISSWPYRCPPAPFEVASLVKYVLEQRGLSPRITVFHEWSVPMEPFGPLMSSMFKEMLSEFKIEYIGSTKFESIDSELKTIRTSRAELKYDLAIIVPPHQPPPPVAESDLAGIDGYMDVKLPSMKSTKYDDVFGIGDVVAPRIGLGMAGVFAHFQGEHVASQILDEVRGVFMGEHYNMSGVCVMDLGYMGAAVYCDFAPKLIGGKQWPDCRMIGGARAFRVVKVAFEKQWFANLFGY